MQAGGAFVREDKDSRKEASNHAAVASRDRFYNQGYSSLSFVFFFCLFADAEGDSQTTSITTYIT